MNWQLELPRPQRALSGDPYDRWVSPEGYCQAEFHRVPEGYLIRFPAQADFLIEPAEHDGRVTGWPAPDCDAKIVTNLYHNAIQPLLGNHSGGLFLHGSAVRTSAESAIAFLGLSRGGKTTLAGSFARAGCPFLTEDVIDLRRHDGSYLLQPKRSKLRLFADSARYLLGEAATLEVSDTKQDIDAGDALPFADRAVSLKQIYILGTDHSSALHVRELPMAEALTALMPHSFILDVDDKVRLKQHFVRLADLSQDITCYALDFTRDYAELPRVRAAILAEAGID